MKKIIALLLMLTLCMAIFAGCNNTDATPSDTDAATPSSSAAGEENDTGKESLSKATAFLFNMYKGSAEKGQPNRVANDFEVTGAVVVGGISYPIDWSVNVTAGSADDVTVVDGTSGNKKIDLNEKPAEETQFTLTATVSDDKGNSESVDFLYFIPAGPQIDTDKEIVIYYPNASQYMTAAVYEYTSKSGSTKNELILSEKKSDAVVLTVVEKDNGLVSFKTKDGKWLFCDGTNVHFAAAEGEYTLFTLEAAENGNYIKSQGTYKDNYQYLEVYNGYLTCYGLTDSSDVKIYTFTFEDAEGAGTTTPDVGGNEITTPDPTPTPTPSGDYVTTPEVGKTYKLGLYSTAKGATYYFTGEMSGYYGATETDATLAVGVTVESAGEGKYYLSFTVGGSKKYIGTEVSGTHLNFKIMDEANRATFTWNAEYATFLTVMSDGTEAFMGTYNNYVTVGMSASSKLSSSYPVHLYN